MKRIYPTLCIRKRLSFKLYLVLVALSLFLSSCASKEERKKENFSELELTVAYDPCTLDPRKTGSPVSSNIQFLLFEGLTRLTPYSTISFGAAKNIDISEDQKTYTFHLREMHWSNGAPITAFDFVQTWKDMLDPRFPSPNAHLLYAIKNAESARQGVASEKEVGIKALDYKTLEIQLEEPNPFFLEMISLCIYFPVYQNVATRISKWAEPFGENFICNGPYRLVKWLRNQEIVIEKNPYYWDKEHVDLDRIRISITSRNPLFTGFTEEDDLDLLGIPFTEMLSDRAPRLHDKGLIKQASLPSSTICSFNANSFPFYNGYLRKAFAYAINRKKIIETVALAHQINNPTFGERAPIEVSPFFKHGDMKTARIFFQKGLRELNISEKELVENVSLLYADVGIYPELAKALQKQWKEAFGIEIPLLPSDYKTFLSKLTKKEYQIAQCAWVSQYLSSAMLCIDSKKNNSPELQISSL